MTRKLTSPIRTLKTPAFCLTFGLCAFGLTGTARADTVLTDDLIVTANICVGVDCH